MDRSETPLGSFLRDRRARLAPAEFGFPTARRRTPGLRREEVAQLAHVSATWYTWLEQGRGGAPSADVLDRLSRALRLSQDEREHLFMLAQNRPPGILPAGPAAVTPRLQQVLDAFGGTPAVLKQPDWTVVAWNRAATALFGDFAGRSAAERNVLRRMFLDASRQSLPGWDAIARHLVGAVRRDITRLGLEAEAGPLIDELSRESPAFRRIWAEREVGVHGEGRKLVTHPAVGEMEFDFTTFGVEGRPVLAMVVFTPVDGVSRQRLSRLIAALPAG